MKRENMKKVEMKLEGAPIQKARDAANS